MNDQVIATKFTQEEAENLQTLLNGWEGKFRLSLFFYPNIILFLSSIFATYSLLINFLFQVWAEFKYINCRMDEGEIERSSLN